MKSMISRFCGPRGTLIYGFKYTKKLQTKIMETFSKKYYVCKSADMKLSCFESICTELSEISKICFGNLKLGKLKVLKFENAICQFENGELLYLKT